MTINCLLFYDFPINERNFFARCGRMIEGITETSIRIAEMKNMRCNESMNLGTNIKPVASVDVEDPVKIF